MSVRRPPHLVVFTPSMYPFQTHGAEIGVYYLVRELVKLGFKISVCLSEFTYQNKPVEKLALPEGMQVVYYSGTRLRVLYNISYILKTILRLKQQFPRPILSIVNVPTLLSLSSAFIAERVLGIPYIAVVHGPSDLVQSQKLIRRLQCRLLQLASAVVCVSADLTQALATTCGRDLHPSVISNGYDEAEIGKVVSSVEDDFSHHQIAFVGTLDNNKDPVTLLRSFRIVTESYPAAVLHIIGNGPLKDLVNRLVYALNISDHVVLHDQMPHFDLLMLIAKCELLVITSRQEGTPTIVIEALALGRPVVATKAGGLPEIVRHEYNGFLAPVGNADTIAEEILQILTDNTLMEYLSKNATTSVSQFRWINIAREYRRLIEEASIAL